MPRGGGGFLARHPSVRSCRLSSPVSRGHVASEGVENLRAGEETPPEAARPRHVAPRGPGRKDRAEMTAAGHEENRQVWSPSRLQGYAEVIDGEAFDGAAPLANAL